MLGRIIAVGYPKRVVRKPVLTETLHDGPRRLRAAPIPVPVDRKWGHLGVVHFSVWAPMADRLSPLAAAATARSVLTRIAW